MTEDKQGNPAPLRPPRQQTDQPGAHGGPTGPAHHEPLSRAAPRRKRYGPGTYGNDQFAAEHHDDFYDPERGADGRENGMHGSVEPRRDKPAQNDRRPGEPKA